jgi:hypothetical protein
VEKDERWHEKPSKPSAVTSSAALTCSIGREVVQEDNTHGEVPSRWKVFFPFCWKVAEERPRQRTIDQTAKQRTKKARLQTAVLPWRMMGVVDEDEEDSKLSLVTSSAQTGSDPGQDVVREEATPNSNPSLVTSSAP